MDRFLILLALAATVGGLVLAGKLAAHLRFRRLRRLENAQLWRALGEMPDGRPTVVAFSTRACVACRSTQEPALAALRARAAVRVIHVDIAEQPDVARAFGMLTVPSTFVLDGSGTATAANHGFATSDRLAAQLGV